VDLPDLADTLLEATIIPSFSRIGPVVRSHLDHWGDAVGHRLDGRVIVITGATSGLGLVAARAWLRAGATVEIVARNPSKADATVAALLEEFPGANVATVTADTGNLPQLHEAAEVLRARHARLDVLVHNAGALDATYEASPSGVEQTVASQVVGPFLLSALLFDRLREAAPGRIVWVTSGGMYTEPLDVGLLDAGPEGYKGTVAYARAKRAQVTLTELMAARVDPSSIVVHAMHPGWALTPGVERSLPGFRTVMGPLLRTPQEGADTLEWLAAEDTTPLACTGKLWLDRRVRPTHRRSATRRADTPSARAALWEWVTAAAGTDFPPTGAST